MGQMLLIRVGLEILTIGFNYIVAIELGLDLCFSNGVQCKSLI